MKAIKIGTLLEAMMRKYGEVPVKIIGLRIGEAKHETIDGIKFSNQVEQFALEEIIKMV